MLSFANSIGKTGRLESLAWYHDVEFGCFELRLLACVTGYLFFVVHHQIDLVVEENRVLQTRHSRFPVMSVSFPISKIDASTLTDSWMLSVRAVWRVGASSELALTT